MYGGECVFEKDFRVNIVEPLFCNSGPGVQQAVKETEGSIYYSLINGSVFLQSLATRDCFFAEKESYGNPTQRHFIIRTKQTYGRVMSETQQ